MKNVIYAVVIVLCLAGAVLVLLHPWSGGSGDKLDASQMTWVKCMKCGEAYEMSEKQFIKESQAKMKAGGSPMMHSQPLTCTKCGQDGIRQAFKCANCGEISFKNSVPRDYEDRCPKCKHSAIEDSRKANLARQGQ
jgi:DNA-directed RNA polymerase subunit RPC12/RpoP